MWPCATAPDSRRQTRPSACQGVALLAALIILSLVSAMGLGLVLTTSLEPAAAGNFECALRARYAAEAGLAVAAHDLGAASDWNAALQGRWEPAHLVRPPAGMTLLDGSRLDPLGLTNLANCGHEGPCTGAELDAFTAERPWGPNNPRWRLLGLLSVDAAAAPASGGAPVAVLVWVGDDPAEADGDPLRDSAPSPDGTARPGACVIALRAEAFAPRAAHRTVTATLARASGGCGVGGRIVSWRDSP
jgi:hypothetical protein